MLSQNQEYQKLETTDTVLSVTSIEETEDNRDEAIGTVSKFHGCYSDFMEMYAPAKTVAEYLNNHASWFSRCAEPMKVELLGQNGYALTIGRFGSFGYEVEPKIGLELLPPKESIYHIRTIPIAGYQAPGYDVDFHSLLQLVENPVNDNLYTQSEMTRVEWELNLAVHIHFPKFIHRLPKSLIQSTGERLLNQIVRQVSRRLTYKVQEDFHISVGLPFPGNHKKKRTP
ncbi:MAG: DUF1997 domain-containing protein [Rhizonema sp. PD38]|nr:DUF1997 domain-containing protein [Rhizonema sp. PD38]